MPLTGSVVEQMMARFHNFYSLQESQDSQDIHKIHKTFTRLSLKRLSAFRTGAKIYLS